MAARSTMLGLLMAAAATSAATGAVSIASPPVAKTAASAPPTRLGVAVGDDIARRDKQAGQDARAMDLREQALRATQARLDASLKAKEEAQAKPQGTTPGAPPPPDEFDSLAKIYTAMKPAKAAPVFAQLDIEVQYLVAKRMSERSTAMILAAMDPEAAARLTMALAGRRPVVRKKP